MKSNIEHKYSQIESFEDLRLERDHLIFRRRLIESKLSLTYLHIREMYSVSNLFFSFAKETVFPKIAEYLGELIKKVRSEPEEEPAKDTE